MNQPGLPNRFWPIVEWAGDRLLVGTIGNGAFWMPFSPAGLKTIVAQKVPEQKVNLAGVTMAPLPGEMQLIWTGKGQLQVESRDGARWLRAPDNAQGSMGVELPVWNGARRLAGEVHVEGTPGEALMALQIFDAKGQQIGWQTLANAANAAEWTPFEAAATLPEGAAKVNLIAIFNGQGALGVRDVQLETPKATAATNAATSKLEPKLLWTGAGKLDVKNDGGVFTLQAQGKAQGSMGVEFPAWQGARTFAGEVKTEGGVQESLIAIQIFDAAGKQIGWQTLADAKTATNWTKFGDAVKLPDGASKAVLVMIFNGEGRAERARTHAELTARPMVDGCRSCWIAVLVAS